MKPTDTNKAQDPRQFHYTALPILDASPNRISPVSPSQLFAIRLFRLTIVALFAMLIWWAGQVANSKSELNESVSLIDAQRIFPEATRLEWRKSPANSFTVLIDDDIPIGTILRTAPECNDLIGYSGPSDLLVGLHHDGSIRQVVLLSSLDTESHVQAVRQSLRFWDSFRGWQPKIDLQPPFDGVSGSTLTSRAMLESVIRRVTGDSPSLRFPRTLTLDEAKQFFPSCVDLRFDVPKLGWATLFDRTETTLGYLLRTSPIADNIQGYRGPTDALLAIDRDQQTILKVAIRNSFDTPDYVARVRDNPQYLEQLCEPSLANWAILKLEASGIEGVSGATQTSYGLAEGIRRRAIADVQRLSATIPFPNPGLIRNVALGFVILGALAMMFTRLRHVRWLRRVWQIIVVVVFAIVLTDLLSMSLLVGWARNGIPFQLAPTLVVLAVVALVVPWLTKQPFYCQQICPHGMVQEWVGRLNSRKLHLPRRLNRVARALPNFLLVAAILSSVIATHVDLSTWEPFDAWALRCTVWASTSIAISGLVASYFLPQAYCRFGCPTGALLGFIRSHGRNDRFGSMDWLSGLVLVVLAAVVWMNTPRDLLPFANQGQGTAIRKLSGEFSGTAWSVTFRDPVVRPAELRDQIAREIERVEAIFSSKRANSAINRINASQTALEMEIDDELFEALQALQEDRVTTTGTQVANEFDANVFQLLPEHRTLKKNRPDSVIKLNSSLNKIVAEKIGKLLHATGQTEFSIRIGSDTFAE